MSDSAVGVSRVTTVKAQVSDTIHGFSVYLDV